MIEDTKIEIDIRCAPLSRESSVQTSGRLLRANRRFESANNVVSYAVFFFKPR